jgi:DNA mismatch repair protein MutS
MAKGTKLTPMMQQYREMRDQLADDTLLLFRLGDFYELFERDAEQGAALLGITLTRRHDMPMAGIPYHAADNYIAKALAAGRKVAIVDQVETPQPGKLVKRALTRIITPGTKLEGSQLDEKGNSYLAALGYSRGVFCASWLELSTGDFQLAASEDPADLLPVIASAGPREILLAEGFSIDSLAQEHPGAAKSLDWMLEQCPVSRLEDYQFEPAAGVVAIQEALGVLNLQGFGIAQDHPALGCAGALVQYAEQTLRARPGNLSKIREYRPRQCLVMDPATVRSLEVFRGADHTRKGSLMDVMDEAVTAAGSRLLESFLCAPPLDLGEIRRRQACVAELHDAPMVVRELRETLRKVRDVLRILGRLQNRMQNPREVGGIRDTLAQLPEIAARLQELEGVETAKLAQRFHGFGRLSELLQRAIADELPTHVRDGGFMRTGYDTDLDDLRNLGGESKTWLANLQASEQERTGIKNLKIKYNGAFGYFIEVSKANLHLVPEQYIRKQTLTNAERFYTEELKVKEKEILNAEERAIARESELFAEVVEAILRESPALVATAEVLAEVDLFAAWSHIARDRGYCRPVLDEGDHLQIEQGRHPVVEQTLRTGEGGLAGAHAFVPNDCALDTSGEQIALLTGPNMAGKSTYIRQVALIALMAHTGSWVPAKSCRIGLVDRIFSRVGASDELARGNSTFMVEMNETANILNNSTVRSLVILDEIGRGTSTYDGLSIAWAVIEHLHGTEPAGPRTLFATHYHELTRLRDTLARLRNYCVAVKEWNDEIIFIRQVVAGAADRSYGIQVARLAGLPNSVLARAQDILDQLEAGKMKAEGGRRKGEAGVPDSERPEPVGPEQMELF